MFELEKTERVLQLISLTKSNSGVMGPDLAKAHIELGSILGEHFSFLDPEDTTIVAILRGGVFFAEGMYFSIGCKFEMFDPKFQVFQRPNTKNVILVDSVVNTGKTIRSIIKPDMKLACCVVNQNAVELFGDQLYTVRVSDNSYVGSNVNVQDGKIGPDTTMRLFNQL